MPADLTPERIAELRKPGKYISDSEVAALLDAAERVRELEADNERLRVVVNGLANGMIEPLTTNPNEPLNPEEHHAR